MKILRDPKKDKIKSNAVMREQHARSATCKLLDCENELSIYDGPGSSSLCREHQLECVEYGGMGKADRPHTFYRKWVCEDCGYDPREDSAFDVEEDPYHKLACMRATLEGDHGFLASHGGEDTEENITTRCCRCHRIKTMLNKDYLGKKKLQE